MSYRNIYFDRKNSKIHHFTWQEDGTPVKNEYYFKPYIYLPAGKESESQATGIDGTPLVKKEFAFDWERRKFVENYKGTVYFNLPPTQQYLLENYYHKDIEELTKFDLRTFFFDIEVIADEFPTATESKFPLTSVTIYDTETKKYYVWGVHKYDHWSCKDHLEGIEPEEIVYEYCVGEKDLLTRFVRFWRKNFPDLIVGYNSSGFDIPYIVGRIEKVLGEGKSERLSPVDNIYGVTKIHPRFKNEYIEFTIGGIAHLDYMYLYKYFTPGERESDALDFVCQMEIDVGKLDYGDKSLKQLAEDDWNRFINYNIWDVKLMVLLDDAKKYLEVAKFSAFSGFCNLDKAFGKTAIITGVLAKQSMENGRIISTQTDGIKESIPGGYVKIPKEGLVENLISYDANSLYPSNIITLNISPETKVAKIMRQVDGKYTVFLFKQKKYIDFASKADMLSYTVDKGWAMSASGVFFDQAEKSISATFCDTLYNKRKKVKDEMNEIEIQMEKMDKKSDEYKQLKQITKRKDVEQYLYKILLNSTYGAFANRFFPLYDIDCAKAITTTGQAMIKQTEKIVNDFISVNWNLPATDRVVFMDTDSISGDSIVRSDKGTGSIEHLYENLISESDIKYNDGREFLFPNKELKMFGYNSDGTASLKKVKYIYRHKTNKRRFKITTASGKNVIVTEDHSCMVMRDGELIEIKPINMKLTDKVVTI